MELDILADGDVGYAVAEGVGEIGDGAGLFAGGKAVGDADADHEGRNGFAFAVFAADYARAVALGVNAARAEEGPEPFAGSRCEAVARGLAGVVWVVPG